MILILSNEYDLSTSKVLEWIIRTGIKVIIIGNNNQIKKILLSFSENGESMGWLTTSNNDRINLDLVKSFWFRRDQFRYKELEYFSPDNPIYSNLQEEWEIINESMMTFFSNTLGNFSQRKMNKIDVLRKAGALGLNIPLSAVTDEKNVLLSIFKGKSLINKTIGEIAHLYTDDGILTNRTIQIRLEDLPPRFYPSLFQENIEKKYELRIFFLRGEFFC